MIGEKLDNLEWAHIEIFQACLQQDFKEEELSQWLEIFARMKNYFFISLCYRDFSNTSIEILKKFFCHALMQDNILKVTIIFDQVLSFSNIGMSGDNHKDIAVIILA